MEPYTGVRVNEQRAIRGALRIVTARVGVAATTAVLVGVVAAAPAAAAPAAPAASAAVEGASTGALIVVVTALALAILAGVLWPYRRHGSSNTTRGKTLEHPTDETDDTGRTGRHRETQPWEPSLQLVQRPAHWPDLPLAEDATTDPAEARVRRAMARWGFRGHRAEQAAKDNVIPIAPRLATPLGSVPAGTSADIAAALNTLPAPRRPRSPESIGSTVSQAAASAAYSARWTPGPYDRGPRDPRRPRRAPGTPDSTAT